MFEIHMAAVNLFGRLPSEFIIQLHHQLNYEPKAHLTEKSWVHGSAQEWAKLLLISAKTFGRMIKRLVDSDIIEMQVQSRGKSNRANYYSLNYETLRRLIVDSHKQRPINTNMWHWFFGTTKIQELYQPINLWTLAPPPTLAKGTNSIITTPRYCQANNISAN